MTAPWIAAFICLWMVALLLVFLQLGWFRRVAFLLEQAEARLQASGLDPGAQGLASGSSVPQFEGADADGTPIRTNELVGKDVIYLFLSSDCEPCRDLVEDLRKHEPPIERVLLVAVVDDTPRGRALRLPASVLTVYQRDEAISRAFGTPAAPHAFGVDSAGTIVEKSIPNTAEHLWRLADTLSKGRSTMPPFPR